MNLLFATKIIDVPELSTFSIQSKWALLPVNNPTQSYNSALKVFLDTIKSYAKLEFNNAIFLIECSEAEKGIIEKTIRECINCNNLTLRFKRPTNKNEWIIKIDELEKLDNSSDYLVCLNHDHLFVDFDCNNFFRFVDQINLKKNEVIVYSHNPEWFSHVLRSNNRIIFKKISDQYFKSTRVDKWVDSVIVSKLDTLRHIFKSISSDNEYLPRFDWPGVSFKNLGIYIFVHPREYFRHYDGYGHVTTINAEIPKVLSFEEYRQLTSDSLNFHYFTLWYWNSRIFLKKELDNKLKNFRIDSGRLIYAIEKSISLFENSYLNYDSKIFGFNKVQLVTRLRNIIYFNISRIVLDIAAASLIEPRPPRLARIKEFIILQFLKLWKN